MKVLVAYTSSAGNAKLLAEKIAEGAKAAGAETDLIDAGKQKIFFFEPYQLVFLGCDAFLSFDEKLVTEKLAGKKVALFVSRSGLSGNPIEKILPLLQAKGATIKSTFAVKPVGFLSFLGIGNLKEDDVIRARGFGERTTNNVFGIDVRRESEKARITGYLK